MPHHLAQANVARTVAPLDDPLMADFVDQLAYINDVAERSPGFVWRLQTEAGDATEVRAFDDPRVIFNMSVWESIEALSDYVYRSEHLAPLRNRRKWFERSAEPHLVMWWIRVGHTPSVAEARERLELLRSEGAGPRAFTFQRPFSPDGGPLDLTRANSAFCEVQGRG